MLRRVINPILFLPLTLSINSNNVLSSETENYISNVLEEKSNITFVDYQEIEKLVLNNQELKSLQNLVTSSSFNLSSQIAKRYPSLDFQANGLPKYVAGKNYNSKSPTLKTSQFTANPSLNIKWDVIAPLRGSEIKIAQTNYKIAENNYEIKKKDLIQEARIRYHKYKKSYQDIQNKKFTLDLSITSLENAKAKLDAGVGTIRNYLEVLREKTQNLPKKVKKPKKVSWIVGKLVYEALIPTVKKLNLIDGFTINLYGLPSIYWGQDQVVTGLLTGEDLIHGLKNKDLGEAVYIPSIMLKINTDLFLDDKNIQEVENQINTKIHVLDDSNDIINTLIG